MSTAVDVKLADFADLVTRWQSQHGRNHLPWQNTRDPYRVWLSEIMLQQTQVATVLNYYERFLQRFPDVQALAAAEEDDVLALWSGLGYYSRARNLHRCAKLVVQEHGGQFPPTAKALAELPGIGQSTANAIASFCYAERVAILDANVRRVLTRVLAFEADLAQTSNVQKLWTEATHLLPRHDLTVNMPRYTQGMMDIGAQICLPRKPQCLLCPVAPVCRARMQGQPTHYPVLTRKLKRTSQAWWLLLLQAPDGSVWLQKRPGKGIWAGLYAPPAFPTSQALQEQINTLRNIDAPHELPGISHTLTHMDLQLLPSLVACNSKNPVVLHTPATTDTTNPLPGFWQALDKASLEATGLPTPVRQLLESLYRQMQTSATLA